MADFGFVPAIIVTGTWNSGKTFSTNMSTSYLGLNAESICIIKDTTLPGLRDRYTRDHFPMLIHDCTDPEVISVALQDCYKGRKIIKANKEMTPGTTLAITCNDAQMH